MIKDIVHTEFLYAIEKINIVRYQTLETLALPGCSTSMIYKIDQYEKRC